MIAWTQIIFGCMTFMPNYNVASMAPVFCWDQAMGWLPLRFGIGSRTTEFSCLYAVESVNWEEADVLRWR